MYNCDLALAEEYLKVVRGIRNQQPFYVTDENGEETPWQGHSPSAFGAFAPGRRALYL